MIQIHRILCPIDFSDYSEHALKYAMKIAVWYGASIDVLHVMPPMPPSTVSPLSEVARQLAVKNLSQAVNRWRHPDITIHEVLIESAEPAPRILERAEAIDADLIITGSHGRAGVSRALLGSVVELLLYRSRVPLLIIPSQVTAECLDSDTGFHRIICGVDFALPSVSALAYALSIAEESDARLTLLNVIEMPPELQHPPTGPNYDVDRVRAEAEAEQLTRLRALVPEHARDYCTVATSVMEGGASRQLLRAAEADHADLIVLGVHGRNALDVAIFGSNSRNIVRLARCPVLIVPAGKRRAGLRAAS